MGRFNERHKEEKRIDEGILTAKIRYCLKRYFETSSRFWLEQICGLTRTHDRFWKELQNRLPDSDIGEYLRLEPVGDGG